MQIHFSIKFNLFIIFKKKKIVSFRFFLIFLMFILNLPSLI